MTEIVQGKSYLMRAPWSRQIVAARALAVRRRWYGRTAIVEWNVAVYDFGEYQYTYPRIKTVMARRLFDGRG